MGQSELLPDCHLIGSLVDTDVFKNQGHRETSFDRLIPELPEPEDFERVRQSGFTWEMFRDYAHAVTPTISVQTHLIAICSRKDKQVAFRLLGRVNQINLLEG